MLNSASRDVLDKILRGLNDAQRAAVTSPSTGQLQIIAGPGTGKRYQSFKIVHINLTNLWVKPKS